MTDVINDWESKARDHAKNWADEGYAQARPSPVERCETCYDARWTNEGGISCNDTISPWPIEHVERHWWCCFWYPRPLEDVIPPNPIGEAWNKP